jgi:uncharacterized protein (TIGR02145 family)
MKKHLLLVAVFSLWGIGGSLYAQVNKTVWVNDSFTISSAVDAAPGTYQWTRNGVVMPASNTKDLTTSESTVGTHTYVRQIKTADCPEWISSNTYVVAVKSELPPNTGTQTWTFSGLTWTMSGQTWSDSEWKQTWSGASSYVPAGCINNTTFNNNLSPRYTNANLQAGSGYLYNYVCVYKERHNLCPAPWRVPTVQDFIDLDRKFGGTGESRSGAESQEYITTNYINKWGGVYGGTAYAGDCTGVCYKGTDSRYWSITGSKTQAHYLHLGYPNGHISPQRDYDQSYGHQLRCVRN